MNRAQHRLVVIGSMQEFVELVSLAKQRGIYTIVCDGYADGPAKKIADKAYTIDVRQVDDIAKMCIEEDADGIIGSFSDLIFEQITKIADKAGLRWYAKPDKLPYYREKDYTKSLLKQLGVHVPKNCRLAADFSDVFGDRHKNSSFCLDWEPEFTLKKGQRKAYAPLPFLRHAVAAAAFSGFMGARGEMAGL